MRTRPDSEMPYFFGPDQALFGVYHGAPLPASRAVLLCAPLGQEQIRCHRLYRQLASTLAAAGIPVLRFDYYGSGDSAGASGEVDLERCVADTVNAAAELRERSAAARIVAFGARLGGSIALAAASSAGFADVVAWDPILDGAAHVAHMDAMQAALREDTQRFTQPRSAADIAGQWLGFDIGERLREQVAALRIDTVDTPTLILDSMVDASVNLLGARVNIVPMAPATAWNDLARLEMAVLSHPLIQAVSHHVEEPA